jgi:predicted GIY-YIG superfamily endonuclease
MNTLYRFYAADDTLLYVGLTVNPGRRLEKHKALQPWWKDVARIDMEQHPDMRTLRDAEREAIETEKPLYNIRMNQRYGEAQLMWNCDVCETPIEDGEGYLTVSYTEIFDHKHWMDAFNKKQQRGLAELDQEGFVVFQLSALNDCPPRAPWRRLHQRCDPNIESTDYWFSIERIRTYPQVLEWTAHLMGKNWLLATNWSSLLRSIA